MKRWQVKEICEELRIDEAVVYHWIECRLIRPADGSGPYLDEEDRGRTKLLAEMQDLYGMNTEALAIMLHLIDQIHGLQAEIKKLRRDS